MTKQAMNKIVLIKELDMAIPQLVAQGALFVETCYNLQNLSILTLGEVIEISTNQYGLSIFSGLISLLALGVYTLLTVDPGNDDDDSDSGSGGLMQPINQYKT